jgi:integrase
LEGRIRLYTYHRRKDGRHAIVIWQPDGTGKHRMKKTGYYAHPDEWDHKKNLPNKKHPGGQKLIDELRRLALADVLADFSFIEFGRQLAAEKKATGFRRNGVVYLTAVNRFAPYCTQWPTYMQLVRFKTDLLSEGLSVNGVATYLRTLRAIWNEAERRDLISGKSPFKRGLIQQVETEKRHLSVDQVRQLMALDGLPMYQDRARMLWLVCLAMRGVDLIDVVEMVPERIRNGYYQAPRAKTGVPIKIRVPQIFHDFAAKGYLDHMQRGVDVRRNLLRELSAVGHQLGFRVQYKMARHTFATLAKGAGCPKDVIREMLGHTGKSVTDVYLGAYDQQVLDHWQQVVIELVGLEEPRG